MEEELRSVWLVGLSGAGKSTVGPLLAERLGFGFIDLDARAEELAGHEIGEIFATEGEEGFRRWEAIASDEAMDRSDVVVATGGGWMARVDLRRTCRGCTRVWLRVRPETAIHRLSGAGTPSRPLLAGPDPVSDLRRLLSQREEAYAKAEWSVGTDGREPVEIADEVMRRLGATAEKPPI